MDQIDDLIPGFRNVKCCICQKITCRSLYGRLKDTTTNQGISTPLPGVGVLAVHSDTELLTTPRGGEQLELWPLPADQSA